VRQAIRFLVLAALASGCSENLTTPGDCPGNCPADHLDVRDTVITAERDSTYVGFVTASQGTRLLLSDGFNGEQSIGVVRFARALDSISYLDTLRLATRDSIILSLTLLGRDSTVAGLTLDLYRLPPEPGLDTTTTYAEVAGLLTDDRRLGTITIPDKVTSSTLRLKFSGAELAKLAFTPADSNVLRLAYQLHSPTPTGIAIGAGASGATGPQFVSWMRATLPDTVVVQQVPRIVLFNATLGDAAEVTPPADLLTVGGIPSARSIVRFSVPPLLTDSSQIVRATLVLVPNEPVGGLPGDSTLLDVRGIFSDLGPKSPRIETNDALIITHLLEPGSADSVALDVTSIARLWNNSAGIPPALMLAVNPEAATFGLARFASSRIPGFAPALRITYARPYPFEVQ
jgi:hypothetical protein